MSEIPIIGGERKASPDEKIHDSFYFGQMFALHMLLKLWDMYSADDMKRFMDARYRHFAKEYPNFYNQLIKVDRRSAQEVKHEYKRIFEQQMKATGDMGKI